MCKADFIKYKTSECPSYERVNTDTAEQQWNKLFVSPNMRKDQVEACSERGESIGKVWRLWIPIGESEVSSKYEDYGVQQQIGDNASKPSESEVSLQREKAEGLLKSCLLDDDGGAPASLLSTALPGPSGADARVAAQAAAKAVPKAKAAARGNPVVLAATMRAKSVKEFREVGKLLERSMGMAEDVLAKDAMKVHAHSQDAVDKDYTLSLLRDRIKLGQLAYDQTTGGPSSLQLSKQLFSECLEDPYLKDLSTTFLTTEAGCMTYGRIMFLRNTALDLQSSVEAVREMCDNMKNAMGLLKKIAGAIQSEAEAWRSNVAMLHKARVAEEAANRKADEKIRKSEALKAKREEEKKKKLADKAAQKAAAAAAKAAEAEAEAEDGDEADGQEGNGDVRKRRCRTSCRVEDMAETDPEVLKEMRASPATTPFATFLTVDEFVGVVSRMPMLPACLRFKKGPLKKALQASDMSASSVTGLSKMLTSDGANFLTECEKAFGDGQERVSKVSPGPAEYLGFDVKCNVAIQGEASHTSAVVLSREFVAEKLAEKAAALGCSTDEKTKVVNRIEGVQWAGFKQGACYSGHLPEGLGSFAYQVEGQRLLVVADLVELLEVAKPDVFQSLTEGGMHLTAEQSFSMLQDLADFLMKVTADSLATFNAEGQLASFRYLYVIAGDCLYLPHGSLVCEKATGSHNTSIRVASMLVTKHHRMALDFMKTVYPMSPICNVFSSLASEAFDADDDGAANREPDVKVERDRESDASDGDGVWSAGPDEELPAPLQDLPETQVEALTGPPTEAGHDGLTAGPNLQAEQDLPETQVVQAEQESNLRQENKESADQALPQVEEPPKENDASHEQDELPPVSVLAAEGKELPIEPEAEKNAVDTNPEPAQMAPDMSPKENGQGQEPVQTDMKPDFGSLSVKDKIDASPILPRAPFVPCSNGITSAGGEIDRSDGMDVEGEDAAGDAKGDDGRDADAVESQAGMEEEDENDDESEEPPRPKRKAGAMEDEGKKSKKDKKDKKDKDKAKKAKKDKKEKEKVEKALSKAKAAAKATPKAKVKAAAAKAKAKGKESDSASITFTPGVAKGRLTSMLMPKGGKAK